MKEAFFCGVCLPCAGAPTFDGGRLQPAADALDISVRVLDLVDGL